MQIFELKGKGRVLRSQLFLQLEGVEQYSSLKETTNAESRVWMPKQVHGVNIITLKNSDAVCVEADATICAIPDQWIGVRTADCVPVLIYDPKKKVVAAIHAGWRGTVKHIVQLTIKKMVAEFGSDATDLFAMIGPSISPEAFEVGQEVVEEFQLAGRAECVINPPTYTKAHIDLWQSNVMDLLEAGLELDHIDCTPLCTAQNTDILYSARKEGIGTGRIITAIRLK